MGFNCGIIGLPNVGKSTLFNALLGRAAATAANYPFTTIDAHVGRVAVPDGRLARIGELAATPLITPTQLEFVDIAGLVRGASKGEGLGNQFLAKIREVDAIAHVLRCFENEDVTHVEGSVDPLRDADIVDTELMLADLESLDRRVETATKRVRGGDKVAADDLALMQLAQASLRDGEPARSTAIKPGEEERFRQLQLLTSKPILYVSNLDETEAAGNSWSAKVAARAAAEGAAHVAVSAAIEAELAQLPDETERQEYLDALGLDEAGLDRFIRAGYELLELITFFTGGPKESRAWTIRRGTPAIEAGGLIHSDFARGFIAVEVIPYEIFVDCGGEQAAKNAGKMRLEGKDYVVLDGDILRFRFNV